MREIVRKGSKKSVCACVASYNRCISLLLRANEAASSVQQIKIDRINKGFDCEMDE